MSSTETVFGILCIIWHGCTIHGSIYTEAGSWMEMGCVVVPVDSQSDAAW